MRELVLVEHPDVGRAWVVASAVKHMTGWRVVTEEDPTLRPGIEAEDVDEPQGVVEPTENPEE